MTLAPVCPRGAVRSSSGQPLSSHSQALVGHVRAAISRAGRGWSVPLSLEDVEDLTQEALLRLWSRYPKRWEQYPRRLVNRVAASVVIDAARQSTASKRDRRRRTNLEAVELALVSDPQVVDRLMAREELAERLNLCQKELTPAQFRVLVLAYFVGLSSREVAARMALAVSTVDATASRLRARLARRGIAVPRRTLRGVP